MPLTVFPIVHLNGTSRDALRAEYESGVRAMNEALHALEQTGPNARDYYPLGPDAFFGAAREHRARLDAIRQVREELLALYEHVDSAGT